jgi:hypothetical protein
LLFPRFELFVYLLGEENSDRFAVACNVDGLSSFRLVNQVG